MRSIFKYLIIIIFFLSIHSVTEAQTLIGLKGGASVSTLGTSSLYRPRLGYHASFFYSQHLEDQYGLQIELQYSLQGARDAATTNGRLNYHYLAVPLLLKLYFKPSTYAEVGPQPAYLIGAKYRELGFEAPRTDQVKRFDLLGIVGFGHERDSGMQMGVRFGVGFLNTSGASVGNPVVFRNLFFQAYVGIKLKAMD